MQVGKVRWYSAQGFGFIDPSDEGEAIYFHISGVKGKQPLKSGESVAFDVIQAAKGPRAVNVTRLATQEANHVSESIRR